MIKAAYKIAVCPQCGGYTYASHIKYADERDRVQKFAQCIVDGDRIEYVSELQLGAMRVCQGHDAGQHDLFGGKE